MRDEPILENLKQYKVSTDQIGQNISKKFFSDFLSAAIFYTQKNLIVTSFISQIWLEKLRYP